MTDWDDIRREFNLSRDYIHMAGMLVASHPRSVRMAIEQHRNGLDENPGGYFHAHSETENESRLAAAQYFGADPAEVALVQSATMGLGLIYQGMDIHPGDEILTTEHDHWAMHVSIRRCAKRTGASVRTIAMYPEPARADAREMVDSAIGALGPRTRVLAVTWVHSSTGVKTPVGLIAEALAVVNRSREEEHRVFLCVDGVHGFGVENETAATLGCDLFVTSCHKWLLGPRGTGIIWGHPRVQRFVAPVIPSSWGGTWGKLMTPGGFNDFEHRWALAEAFRFHQRIGKAQVTDRIHWLCSQLKAGLFAIDGVDVFTPLSPEVSSGIVCLSIRGRDPFETAELLKESGVVATASPFQSPRCVRLTPGLWTTPEEVERTVRVVEMLASH